MNDMRFQKDEPISFYVGTYTNGESRGIYKYLLHQDGSLSPVGLAGKTENPSFLALGADKSFLLAVNEIDHGTGAGTVESYSVDGDQLRLISSRSSGGNNPCFVTVDKSGNVLVANYSGGNVGFLRLEESGALTDILDIQQHEGDEASERQDAPHAHSVWFEPSGDGVISVDLGTNELWFSRLDVVKQKFIPSDQTKLSMDSGAGPRHLDFHPNGKWIYVVNELNSTVTLITKTLDALYEKGPSFSTLPAAYTKQNTCSDIHISSDGNFLYVANRGHDSIAVFGVVAVDGSLKLLGHKSSGGNDPRSFSLSPDENHLLVANQHSNNIVVLRRDNKSGLLKYKNQSPAPTPTCILF